MSRSVTGEKDSGSRGGGMCHTDTWCSRWQLCGQMALVTCTNIHKHTHACTLTHKHILYTYSQLVTPWIHTHLKEKKNPIQSTYAQVKQDVHGNKQKTLHRWELDCAALFGKHKQSCVLARDLVFQLKEAGWWCGYGGQIKETPWCMLTLHIPTALLTTCHFPACGAITPPKSPPVLFPLKGNDIQVWTLKDLLCAFRCEAAICQWGLQISLSL